MTKRQHDLQRKRQQCEVRTMLSIATNRPHTRILTLHFCDYQGRVRTLGNCVHLASSGTGRSALRFPNRRASVLKTRVQRKLGPVDIH